ncbi:hypothetical protein CMI41_00370 [Candidatus Pacearchaeota archaeon]|nr:hypothetical protein [Candidatus Pacearchaeota archaeon]|tara:strand:- start:19431 stop:19724 length:294 start_codon:yes stop_codon:yes gene_type:complete
MAEEVEGLKILKQSKALGKLKKGDKIFINGKEMRVDSQYVFMEHGKTKEMIIEFFNSDNDREYQLRYFDDQVEMSLEVYELQEEFQYVRREPKTIAW